MQHALASFIPKGNAVKLYALRKALKLFGTRRSLVLFKRRRQLIHKAKHRLAPRQQPGQGGYRLNGEVHKVYKKYHRARGKPVSVQREVRARYEHAKLGKYGGYCAYHADYRHYMNGLTSTGMAQKCRDMNVLFTDASKLQAGDLIFFACKDASRSEGYCTDTQRCGTGKCKRWLQIHHVAIYINGEFLIDSTGGNNSVQIRKHWGRSGSEWEWVCFGRPTS